MADPAVRTYDPNSIIVSFMGKTLAGFAEGSFLKIKRSGDMFTKVKGADGSVDRINNKVWHLLGFLLQTARSGVTFANTDCKPTNAASA